MENALEVRGINKKYKHFRLKDVNITIPKGYLLGFIGANGAGKTTTIKSILNLIRTDSGEVYIYGKKNTELTREEKERIGVVMDRLMAPKNISWKQLDNIMKNIYKSWDSGKFADMCMKAGLPEKGKIDTYSKGMEMKLAIACAMSHDPWLLIMDEPTSGLDPMARGEVLDMLLEFLQDENHSVLMSSHITSDLEKVADYITFIRNGEIIMSEEREEMLSKYALLKCSDEELARIPHDAVVSHKKGKFGTERLVIKDRIGDDEGLILDRATIDDIMIFYNVRDEEDY